MKLCTYFDPSAPGAPRPGLVREDLVHDAAAILETTDARARVAAAEPALLDLIRAGDPVLDALRRFNDAPPADATGRPLTEVKLIAPLPRPNSIRDCLLFEEHMINAMETVAKKKFPPAGYLNAALRKTFGVSLLKPARAWYEAPVYYKGNPDTVIGPDQPVLWPSYTEQLDYELEFALVIGRAGRDIAEQDAMSHVAGYTIFNDFSARDVQMKEMSARLGPAKGKDFDTGNALGPWLVTPDEVGDPYALKMEAFVNGECWSSGESSKMHHSFAQVIAYISRSETLHPGDVIGSGTVGTGCGLELDRWLKPGDRVTLRVDKLGELSNPVVREP